MQRLRKCYFFYQPLCLKFLFGQCLAGGAGRVKINKYRIWYSRVVRMKSADSTNVHFFLGIAIKIVIRNFKSVFNKWL